MSERPASSAVSTAASASSGRSAVQHYAQPPSQLAAYLQDQSYRPPIAEWSDGTHGVGVQERLVAAANYSFPHTGPDPARQPLYAAYDYPYATSLSISKSSMAPSQYPAPHIHNRASTVASGYDCSIPPPSLAGESELSSRADSSIDTDLGKVIQGFPLLEEGPDGVLVRPRQTLRPVYECTFGFLGCRDWFENEDDWRTHNLSHFHGNTPPRSVSCPLCDFGYDDPTDGYKAWEARMSHLAAHLRLGQNLSTSRPDFQLYRYLWQKRIVDDAEYKELNGGGTLSFQSTQGRALDDRRGRRQHHPRFPQTIRRSTLTSQPTPQGY